MLICGIGGISQVFADRRQVPIYCVDRTDNYVAISFDAAWGADKTRAIMDVCDSYNVKATFFLVGFWIDKYPDMVAEIHSRGFEIGTHSSTHPEMSKLSEEKCKSELVDSKKSSILRANPLGCSVRRSATITTDCLLRQAVWACTQYSGA